MDSPIKYINSHAAVCLRYKTTSNSSDHNNPPSLKNRALSEAEAQPDGQAGWASSHQETKIQQQHLLQKCRRFLSHKDKHHLSVSHHMSQFTWRKDWDWVRRSAPSPEELHQAFEHRSQPPGAGIYTTCLLPPPPSVYFKTIAGVGYLLKWAQYEHFLSRCLQQPLSQMNLHKATTTRENHNSLISDGLFRMTLGKGIKRKETNEDVKLELNAAVYPVTAAQLFKH